MGFCRASRQCGAEVGVLTLEPIPRIDLGGDYVILADRAEDHRTDR
jgi:hypothetical protein